MSAERVLGGVEVETRLQLGKEHLFLLFTQKRLILAYKAKIGRGSTALFGLLGGLAGILGKARGKGSLLGRLAGLPPESILALHKDNFGVGYDQVVSLAVEPGGYDRVEIILVTSDMKVEMSASRSAVQRLREILELELGGKVSFRL